MQFPGETSALPTARRQETSAKSWWGVVLTGMAAVLGSVIRGMTPAIAASDNNPRTYAGDYQGGSLPIGTFIAFQYASYSHADAFVDPPGTRCRTRMPIRGRVTYFGELANHSFVPDLEVHCELLPTLAGINFGEPGPMRGCTMKRLFSRGDVVHRGLDSWP